jgi:AraC-like DNA-binding protein
MEYVRKLSNNNKICYGTVRNATAEVKEDRHTFKFVLRGQQDYLVGKRKLSLYPDCFLFLPEGTSYKSVVDSFDTVDLFSVSVSADMMDSFHSFYPLTDDMRANVLRLYQQMVEGESDELLINKYIDQCLQNYYKIRQREINERIERLGALRASTREELFRRLVLAKEFISNNYDRKFNLKDVAKFSCLSVNHLLRTFKEAYGLSPNKFLSRTRLDRAKYFLEKSDYSVAYISMLVGFDSISSFIRLFKSVFNTTPMKYKRGFIDRKPC